MSDKEESPGLLRVRYAMEPRGSLPSRMLVFTEHEDWVCVWRELDGRVALELRVRPENVYMAYTLAKTWWDTRLLAAAADLQSAVGQARLAISRLGEAEKVYQAEESGATHVEKGRGMDLVALVRQVVRLNPKGPDYSGNCPFHRDCALAFHVSLGKQIFYCFGCQKSGDVGTFLILLQERSAVAGGQCDSDGTAIRSGHPAQVDGTDGTEP